MEPDTSPGAGPPVTGTPATGVPTTRRQAREQAGRPYRSDRTATNPAGLRTSTSTSTNPRGLRTAFRADRGPDKTADRATEKPARPGRADPPPPPGLPGGKHAPMLVAAVVAALGAALVVVGALQATVFKQDPVTTAALSSPGTSVVSTAVGVLGLEGNRVSVDASGSGPVFIGIGRAADVDAYLAGVSRQEVTGEKDGKLLTEHQGTQSSLPDPAGVDVWVISTRSQGHATLSWPDAAGQWRMVVATNGTTPAPATTFTWSGRVTHSKAPQLISIGLVLAIGGLITILVLFSRSRLDRDDEEDLG